MASYRCTRRALSVALVAGIGCAAVLGLTDTAAAAVTANSCSGSIAGNVGEAVTLRSDTVKKYVVESVDDGPEAPLVGWKNERTRMREAFEDGKFEPIKLPEVPNSASTRLSGKQIATAVLAKIDSVDEVSDIANDEENRKNIKAAVGKRCGLTVTATNYTPAASAQPRIGSGQQGNDQAPSQWQGQSATTQRQTGVTAPPPSVRYGTDGTAPSQRFYGGRTASTGLPPGTVEPPALPDDIGRSDRNVDNAGNAEAVEAERRAAAVRLPLLLAVVALACVAAALVRTWVLRKVG